MEIRCSKLARVMNCHGSIAFTNLPEEEENEAAREGTAAGEWMKHLIDVAQGDWSHAPPTHASNGVLFDDDMKYHTKSIAEDILDTKAEGTTVFCEKRCDWDTKSGIVIRGQPDADFIGKDGKLYVDDLKYGWGIVEVKNPICWQLIGYAIGVIMRRSQYFPSIVLRIRQPRPHHEDGPCRTWEITYDELLAFKEQIEERAMQIATGTKTLTTSHACKYCPAAAKCPAISKAFYRGVEVIHEFLQDNIEDKEVSFQLDQITRIEELIKIRKGSLTNLAIDRIKKGALIPNYVMQTSYSDRSWKDGISPAVIEAMTGVKIVEQVMLSPAKAEKAGISPKLVNDLVDRRFLGTKLKRKDTTELGNKIFGNTEEKK